ncbi:hypothetical protein E0H83_01135 [Acinetobacter terrestris]|uniref:hypothetical protein n=1 Tax=Acinetobacter terrestris TaxID=2529843 RepID=UPI001038DE0C|nr:hypothetical protein [Acinetobacter terrestris]TCB48374.1 hypothetical protein E0H83_01135 [Acinetobacter terrestris]
MNRFFIFSILFFLSSVTSAYSVKDFRYARAYSNKPATQVQYSNLSEQEKKAMKQMIEYINPHIAQCEGRVFYRFRSVELKEIMTPKPTIYFQTFRVNEVDRLNGVSWKGILLAKMDGKAGRTLQYGHWTNWKETDWLSDRSVNLPAKIENGELEYDIDASDFVSGSRTDLPSRYRLSCETVKEFLN